MGHESYKSLLQEKMSEINYFCFIKLCPRHSTSAFADEYFSAKSLRGLHIFKTYFSFKIHKQ